MLWLLLFMEQSVLLLFVLCLLLFILDDWRRPSANDMDRFLRDDASELACASLLVRVTLEMCIP